MSLAELPNPALKIAPRFTLTRSSLAKRQSCRGIYSSTRGNLFIYLGAFICFVLAAMGEGWRFGARTRGGLAPRIVLVPLGLALFVLPQVIAYGRGF